MTNEEEKNITDKPHLCLHCGNETLMKKAGECTWGSNEEQCDILCYSYNYQMLFCPVCHKVSLLETYGDEDMQEYDRFGEPNYYSRDTILYPINTIDSNAMPKNIKEAFESALKVRNIDVNACSLLLRRTLEIILTDQGATKWGLKDKIEEIAAKGILPDSLKEASFFTKKYGDSAAHGKELTADDCDIEKLIEFIEYIIDYLYIIPTKIKQFKKRIDQQEEQNG